MDAEGYRAIEGALTALPKADSRININTASALALMSLSPQLSMARAQSLIESERRYVDAQTLAGEVPELNSSLEAMKVTSDFFEVLARAEVNGVRTDLRSVLHRCPLDGRVTLLSRDLGHRFPLQRLAELDEEEGG
jgi:type II secretory pathway component PulK